MGAPNNLLYLQQVFERYTLAVVPNPFVTADWSMLGNFTPARCQAKFLTSCHVRVHKVLFYISNTLRKLIIRA